MSLKIDELTCIICYQVFDNPHVDSCGHSFCFKCIEEWQKANKKCPISKKPVEGRLVKNFALKEIIDSWQHPCDNRKNGCSWIGKPRRYHKKHKPKCLFGEFNQGLLCFLKDPSMKHFLSYTTLSTPDGLHFEGFVDESGQFTFGILKDIEGRVYEGNFDQNVKSGIGRLTDVDGLKYEAMFKCDQLNGFCIIYENDLVQFEGHFVNGKKEGKGTMFFKDRKIYVTHKEGEMIGKAKIVFGNKNVFLGMIRCHEPVEGKLTYKEACKVYNGRFANDLPEGIGEMKWKNGDHYEGEFSNGMINGVGVMIKADKTRYHGEFKDGNWHGNGTYYYTNGKQYIGQFKDNKFHGQGTLIDQFGNRITGEFVKGSLKNPAFKYFNDGNIYEGNFVNEKIEGLGTMKYANGDVYTGKWNDEKRHDTGKMVYANGDVFEGRFNVDQRNGAGRFIFANKDVFEGFYKNDKAEGSGKLIFENGSILEGTWVNDLLNGESKFKENGKPVQVIFWKDGVKSGKPMKSEAADKPSETKPMHRVSTQREVKTPANLGNMKPKPKPVSSRRIIK